MSYVGLTDAMELYERAIKKRPTFVYMGRSAMQAWVRGGGHITGLTPIMVPEYMPDEWAVGDEDGPVYGSRGVK
jgi:hypothetical protein